MSMNKRLILADHLSQSTENQVVPLTARQAAASRHTRYGIKRSLPAAESWRFIIYSFNHVRSPRRGKPTLAADNRDRGFRSAVNYGWERIYGKLMSISTSDYFWHVITWLYTNPCVSDPKQHNLVPAKPRYRGNRRPGGEAADCRVFCSDQSPAGWLPRTRISSLRNFTLVSSMSLPIRFTLHLIYRPLQWEL